MKIFYDGYIWSVQSAGGINRYFSNIIARLPPDFQPVIATDQQREVNWPSHPNLETYVGRKFRPARISDFMTRRFVNDAISGERPDIVHPTYYEALSGRTPDSFGCPSVITVCDFIHRVFAQSLRLDLHGHHEAIQSRAILAADAILCISQHTRADLLRYFPSVEAKTTVTPLASELNVSMAHSPHPVPEQPYFVYMGSRVSYKNFDGLLRALALTVAKHREVVLAVVGKPFDTSEKRLIQELNIESSIRHMGEVDDCLLAKLLNKSLALVYPSHYEGFGIPPLEAMNCETVVIAANNTSIPEVTGQAALLFPSDDIDALFQLMSATAQGSINRAALIEQGKIQASKFTWDKTAELTVEVYRQLLSK